ncbi:MAG: tRNA 2-thiouridine(34) synthase MnmA [Bacteroidota bacterium]
MKRIVVGLSGGVDSSVAAYILKEEGYEVIGLFMKNWHDDSVTISDECPWLEDSNDALLVAQKLNIPFQTVDMSKEYKERIVDYMFEEYEAGRTPNPDVLCNREIKFDVFLKTAISIGADYVATGHYCRKFTQEVNGNKVYSLLAGIDVNKDQSYFLCQLKQEQLAKAVFPIGNLTKKEVREIAKKQGFITAEKKDSQGLCFVGKVRLPEFLQQKLKPKSGKIIEIDRDDKVLQKQINTVDDFQETTSKHHLKMLSNAYHFNKDNGIEVGQHQGAHFFTIGQRKGMHVGGTPLPLFVLATDVEKNIIYTGQGSDHPGLYRSGLYIKKEDIHWVREDLRMQTNEKRAYLIRIRYRQNLEQATIFMEEDGMYIIFKNKQKGITPGQFAAWYDGDELIGSGVIAP